MGFSAIGRGLSSNRANLMGISNGSQCDACFQSSTQSDEILFQGDSMKRFTCLTTSQRYSFPDGPEGESDWGESAACGEVKGVSGRLCGLLGILLLILSGCGSDQYYFSKPGFSQQQYNQDEYECLRAAQEPMLLTLTPGMPAGGMVTNKNVYFACFRAKGYTITSEDQQHRQQQRQTEYQQLMAEKRVFDEQKRVLDQQQSFLMGQKHVFDEQKRVLDEQRVALSGGEGLQQYEQAVGAYTREVEDYTSQVADFNSRLADYNKQVADFNKRLANYAR
jgi:hypothetical protein